MNERREVPFVQSDAPSRYALREPATGLAELPAPLTCWAFRACPKTAKTVAQPAKPAKKESWRTTPTLPASTPKQSKPRRPSEADPEILPSRERIMFGWEADLTEIEWVVTTFVKKEHPQLFEEIVRRAIEKCGYVDPPKDTSGPRP